MIMISSIELAIAPQHSALHRYHANVMRSGAHYKLRTHSQHCTAAHVAVHSYRWPRICRQLRLWACAREEFLVCVQAQAQICRYLDPAERDCVFRTRTRATAVRMQGPHRGADVNKLEGHGQHSGAELHTSERLLLTS